MFGLDEETVDIVEPAIGCFSHQWTGPALKDRALLHLPSNNGIVNNTDAVRVGNPDRTFEEAAFLHPCRAGHLTVAVEREPGRKDGIMIRTATRVDNGDTRPG